MRDFLISVSFVISKHTFKIFDILNLSKILIIFIKNF